MEMFIPLLNNFKEKAKPNNNSKIAPNKTYNPIENPVIKLKK